MIVFVVFLILWSDPHISIMTDLFGAPLSHRRKRLTNFAGEYLFNTLLLTGGKASAHWVLGDRQSPFLFTLGQCETLPNFKHIGELAYLNSIWILVQIQIRFWMQSYCNLLHFIEHENSIFFLLFSDIFPMREIWGINKTLEDQVG